MVSFFRLRLPGLPILALTVASTGCSAPPLPEDAVLTGAYPAPVEVRRQIAYDDVLQVEIYPQSELSGGRRVDYEGNIDLPLLGPIQLLGLTLSDAREALQERAQVYFKDASVAISVLSYGPRLFYILGEVEASGPFELRGPLTALQALSGAGGVKPTGDLDEVVLLRVSDDHLVVHAFNAETPGPDGLIPVEPGDLLFVRKRGAGSFQHQVAPYLQSLAPPFSAVASLLLVADRTK